MQDQGKPSRRTRTRWPGVYYRETPKGRRYEISFSDSTGRRRWRTIDGGEKEARAALEEVRGRKRKGERIAPSRATLAEVTETWLREQTGNLRPRTVERYEGALRSHVLPRLGRVRVAELDEDDLSTLIADLRDGRGPDGEQVRPLSGWSIRAVLVPLGRVLGYAARRGIIASNPMQRLERGERPAVGRREQRVLSEDEIRRLLDAADPTYRAFIATAVFSGLRLGELLGLTWADVDFEAGEIRVRYQLDRDGGRVPPKTPQAVRAVVLFPALGRMLRDHKAASAYSRPADPVFASRAGTPFAYRNVERRGLDASAERAGLNGDGRPKLRLHDCRHTFASLLIAEGADVVYVSRQLGHADPSITLKVYSHLFDKHRHADRTRRALEARYANMLNSTTEAGAVLAFPSIPRPVSDRA